jgi:hypothetical protein
MMARHGRGHLDLSGGVNGLMHPEGRPEGDGPRVPGVPAPPLDLAPLLLLAAVALGFAGLLLMGPAA